MFHNKIALITGASRGLGRATALHLAARGVHIMGTYHSSADEAEKVIQMIEQKGVTCSMVPLNAEDLNHADFVGRVNEQLATRFHGTHLDYIVHNAGIGIYARFSETSAEQLDQLYRIHVRTPLLLTQALLPSLHDGASVVFVSSGLTRFTLPGHSAYAAMKGAVEVLTRYAAKELGARDIRVNCVAPGAIETDFGGGAVRDNLQMNERIASMTALGRAGLPDDIGSAIAAMLSDEMGWMNGERVEVSGGQSL